MFKRAILREKHRNGHFQDDFCKKTHLIHLNVLILHAISSQLDIHIFHTISILRKQTSINEAVNCWHSGAEMEEFIQRPTEMLLC